MYLLRVLFMHSCPYITNTDVPLSAPTGQQPFQPHLAFLAVLAVSDIVNEAVENL